MADTENNAAAAQAEGTTNKKKSVLLSFVGDRDPFARDTRPDVLKRWNFKDYILSLAKRREEVSDGSILSLCDHPEICPDIVYLFPSSGSEETGNPQRNTAKNARSVEEELKQRHPALSCRILPLEIKDATDFEQISKEWERNINIALNGLGDINDYQFHLNCSSGTPQMTAVGYVFASTGRIPGLIRWQCKDPKEVRGGQERIREIETTFLDENALIRRIDANLERYHFHSIIADCESLMDMMSVRQQLRIRAKFIRDLFIAYEKMDFLQQYQAAYETLERVSHDFNEEKESIRERFSYIPVDDISKIFEDQKDFLDKMKGEENEEEKKENSYNLVDLYFNMERAFARGNYVDVLARFWRLREGMMYHRLLVCHGIEKRVLRNSKAESRQRLENDPTYGTDVDFAANDGKGAFLKDRPDWFERMIVEVFDDKQLKDFKEKFRDPIDRLNRLRIARNKSIVGHGIEPVQEQDARECLYIGREVIALIPDRQGERGQDVFDKYPFRLNDMKTLVSLLKQA